MKHLVFTVLSFLPVVCLVFFSLFKNIKTASVVSFLLTTILFFLWENSIQNYLASLISSFVSAINILMIVFGALFLFTLMEGAGVINEIKEALIKIHPSKEILFFFISICLTSFFEGVAGFGTPGAIVPPILISMGFNPIVSVATVLLLDGLFAAFGAVGKPLVVGVQQNLNLPDEAIRIIGLYSSVIISLVGFLFLIYTFSMYSKVHGKITHKGKLIVLYLFFAGPFIVFSWYATDLSTVLSAVIMLVFSIFYLSKGKVELNFKPWYPYILLIFLLLLPKIVPLLSNILNFDVKMVHIFGTKVSSSIKPLKSPLIPFLIAGIFVMLLYKKRHIDFKPIFSRTLSVFLLLFPILCVSSMMLNSGMVMPSMTNLIAQSFVSTQSFYLIISPFLGMVGSFITGSTTVSNIVFSASQKEIAEMLGFNSGIILALQHTGASIGNAICLFNIVAAALVAGIKEENKILAKTFKPTIIGGLVAGALGFVLLYLIQL